jgi:MFS transporter, DHA2 family, multidrug resistance protein
MDIKPLFGLGGVLIAAMTSEFNDQHPLHSPTSALRSGSATIPEPGSKVWTYRPSSPAWRSAPLLMIFTLRRWTLAIALCGASSMLIPFSPNIEAIYALRLIQGLAA